MNFAQAHNDYLDPDRHLTGYDDEESTDTMQPKSLYLSFVSALLLNEGAFTVTIFKNMGQDPETKQYRHREEVVTLTGTITEALSAVDNLTAELKAIPGFVCVAAELVDPRMSKGTPPFLIYTNWGMELLEGGNMDSLQVYPSRYQLLSPEEEAQAEEIIKGIQNRTCPTTEGCYGCPDCMGIGRVNNPLGNEEISTEEHINRV